MRSRVLTVSKINRPSREIDQYKAVASIRLSGSWIEALGFRAGNRIEVREYLGRIELIAFPSTKEGKEP